MCMRKNYFFLLASIVSIFTMAVLTGCGQGTLPATVQGAVTVNGSPAPKGLEIIFQPKGEGVTCYGYTDSEGKYELSLNPRRKGAQPGVNTVTVQPLLIAKETPATDDRGTGAGSEEVVPSNLKDLKIAKEFKDPGTHEVTVKDGPNTIDLENCGGIVLCIDDNSVFTTCIAWSTMLPRRCFLFPCDLRNRFCERKQRDSYCHLTNTIVLPKPNASIHPPTIKPDYRHRECKRPG